MKEKKKKRRGKEEDKEEEQEGLTNIYFSLFRTLILSSRFPII